MNKTLKSILAVLAGFVAIFILTAGFDTVLEKAGLLTPDHFDSNPGYIIGIAIICRAFFITGGACLTARLAPSRPMLHAMILGCLGVLINISGTVMMWNTAPHWFPILLNLLPLPCGWLGAKLKK